jgi:hypothetical protein
MERQIGRGPRAGAFARWVSPILAAGALLGCVKPLPLDGRGCPCAEQHGFVCCETTGRCVRREQLATCPASEPVDGAASRPVPAPPISYPPPGESAATEDAAPPARADAGEPLSGPDAPSAPPDAGPMACLGEPRGVRYFHWEELYHAGQSATGQAPVFSFSWPTGQPDPSLPADSSWSSVFATQLLPAASGDYTFFVNADDGFFLWLDQEPVISWGEPYTTGGHVIAATVPLVAGRRYSLMVDYYNKQGGGLLDLSWAPPGRPREPIPACDLYLGPPRPANCADPFDGCWPEELPFCTREDRGNGLDISFYTDRDFRNLVHTEDIALLAFYEESWDWLYRANTDPALRDRKFAIRWHGDLRAPVGETFTFFLLSDADTTVTIGDRQHSVVADPSGLMKETSFTMPLSQRAAYPIRVDYLQHATPATSRFKLYWKSATMPKGPISYCYLYGSAPPVVWEP